MSRARKTATKRARYPMLSFRVSREIIDRVDALIPVLALPGMSLNRSDAARVVLTHGLAALEKPKPPGNDDAGPSH